MGGLVAVDTLIGMAMSRPDTQAPLWPRIVACIALDTPVKRLSLSLSSASAYLSFMQYLGLHPFVFKNSANKAFGYVQTARDVANAFRSFSTSSSKATPTKAPVAAITAPPSPAAPSSGSAWTKWAVPAAYGLGGVLLSGAAASAAYYKREDLGLGYKWATDHMKYVGTMWEEEKLKKRLEDLMAIERNLGVPFRKWVPLLSELMS